MLLNKLELLGFKSFHQKLKIAFGPGITCIVGPNGCGKTNIADAIRWALGEQSAKALRGGSMGDVIFNGTANRKPLGMADVTLTFSNSRAIIPLEYDEIAVNRRMYRDGVSEYSLNKTPCRLKDIKDVFFDTGIGSHAYSLIEQEMVDHVLSDNSDHRRLLFEEAAGIMKYKARRREALLKLEATENDLVRVDDILVEIEREANSLRRQIARARRFKRLEAEIKELDVALAVLAYGQYDEEVKRLSTEQELCLAKKGKAAGSISSREASLEKLKLSIIEEERKMNAAASELAEVEEEQAGIRDRILVLKERRDALDSRCEGLTEDIRHVEEKMRATDERSKEASDALACLGNSVVEREDEVERKNAELVLSDRDLLSARNDIQSLGEWVAEARTEETQRTSKLEELSAMKGEMERQLTVVSEEIAQLEAKLGELRSSEEDLSKNLAKHGKRLADVKAAIGENVAQQQSLESELDEVRVREATLAGNAKRIEGRLSALESSAIRHRERRKLVRKALERVQGNVAGLLDDLVRIPPEFSAAFGSILDKYGPIVIVDNRETALSCFAALEEEISGRFSILELEQSKDVLTQTAPETVLSSPGVIGEAIDLVDCPQELKGALCSLLEGTVIIETARSLHDVRSSGEHAVRFVTRDGGLVCRGRILTGGKTSYPGGLTASSELVESKSELEEVRRALSECTERAHVLEAERAETRERGKRLSSELAELRVRMSSDERNISVHVAEMKLLDNRLDSLRKGRESVEGRVRSYSEQMEHLDKEVSELRLSLAPKSQQFDTQSALIKELEERREAVLAELSEFRMAEVREHARKNELLSLTKRMEEEKVLLATEAERKKATLEGASATRARGEAERSTLEQRAAGVAEIGEEREDKLDVARSSCNLLRKEAAELEDQIKIRRRELEQLSEEAHTLELSLTRQKIEREGVARRVHAEHGTDVTVEPPPADDFDSLEAQQRLEVAREKMRSLGPVNLLALEEFEKKKERLDFIRDQREDLLQAKSCLLEVIEKINERASALFLDTYNSVQGKFQETFRTLFEGGDAELRLIGEDPLEGEIEIVARPRGKSLQSLNLLSGGERALTAIALLFALYLIKPSPFCILDEVDAPLDDANIVRFVSMLKRFNEKTQFIVITHNKKTMEAADCLYGITMQEPGVSKVVSVRLTGVEEPQGLAAEAVGVES